MLRCEGGADPSGPTVGIQGPRPDSNPLLAKTACCAQLPPGVGVGLLVGTDVEAFEELARDPEPALRCLP